MRSLYSAVKRRRLRFSRSGKGVTCAWGNVIESGYGIDCVPVSMVLKSMLSQTDGVDTQVDTQEGRIMFQLEC